MPQMLINLRGTGSEEKTDGVLVMGRKLSDRCPNCKKKGKLYLRDDGIITCGHCKKYINYRAELRTQRRVSFFDELKKWDKFKEQEADVGEMLKGELPISEKEAVLSDVLSGIPLVGSLSTYLRIGKLNTRKDLTGVEKAKYDALYSPQLLLTASPLPFVAYASPSNTLGMKLQEKGWIDKKTGEKNLRRRRMRKKKKTWL